ncbi:MAG: ABC transporter ATP-binding protein [Candidatus Eisenbacteria bacterium]|uniref:ABC transporter ATP-binding protein n=1 Tax=Eiseniibacteriota bacterium TaxID=2212470 RepID=A0A849SE02_UNCEI|nr:ABC transporter ATP-binding protein [Candidatus Eisenbacteria bacterium]
MKLYLRLLGYLAPYRARLLIAMFWMLIYAVSSTVTISMVSPLLQVMFERGRTATRAPIGPPPGSVEAARVTGPERAGIASAAEGRARESTLAIAAESFELSRIARWPQIARARVERSLLGLPPLAAVSRICLLLLVVILIKNLADYLQSFLMVAVEQAALRDLRGDLQRHLQRLSLSFYHARRTGNLVARLTHDFEYLRMALAASTSTLVKDALTLLGGLAIAFYVSGHLALLSLVILPPAAWLIGTLGRQMRRRSTQSQERMGDLAAMLQEAFAGARVIKAFGGEAHEARRFARANADFNHAYVRMRRVAAAARPLSEVVLVAVAVGMLWLGAREIFVRGTLAPHQFMLFVIALVSTVSPIRSLADVNTNIQQGLSAAKRVFDVLDTAPDVTDRPGARALGPLRDRIRFEHVRFAYDGENEVLRDLSLEVRRGEVVALVGSSGAGKSTAMDLIPRFHDPSAGRVTIDGVDLRDLTMASLRAQLAVVTQETFLFHDTLRNNIAYGTPEATDAAIEAAAEAAHAHEFIRRLPNGYATLVGERGLTLSGGERQRIAIARAILRNAPLLLLDEATSSLDAESERLVQEALERLMQDRTVLVIAHRLSTVQHADRIVVLEAGRVVASGTHRELLGQDGPYRRLYDLQFVA